MAKSKLTKMAKRLLDPKTKTLIKAGYLTNDLQTTDAGRLALAHIAYERDIDLLVKAAEEKIADEKEEADAE